MTNKPSRNGSKPRNADTADNRISDRTMKAFALLCEELKHERKLKAELLEALQRLLRADESDFEQCPDMDVKTAFETNSQAIKQAREAIAKAKGPQ